MITTRQAIGALFAGSLLFAACGDDDDPAIEDPTSESEDMDEEDMDDEEMDDDMDDSEG